MKLKVGDKLLCKKKYKSFTENNQYEIKHIDKQTLALMCDSDGIFSPTLGWFKFNEVSALEYILWTERDNYIWKYFYTSQEMRQLKLKQIDRCYTEKIQ